MNNLINILHLEDNPADAELVKIELEKIFDTVNIELTKNKSDYQENLKSRTFDLILSDYNVPGFEGFESLKISNNIKPEIPVIFITGALGEELAVEILKAGASDYVLKDNLEKLPISVKRVLKEVEEKRRAEKIEEELKESERKYKAIFRSFKDIYYQLDKEHRFTLISPSVFELLGYSENELQGRSFETFFKNRSEYGELLQELNSKKEIQDFHFIGLTKEKKELFLSVNATYESNGDGVQMYGVIRNITEKKKSELLLQRTQENLIQAQRIAKIGSYRYNVSEKKMAYWSDELFRIFQFDKSTGIPDESEFQSCLVNKSQRKRISDALLYSDQFLPFEQIYKYKGEDNVVRHIKEIVRPFYAKDGSIKDVLGTVQDITEQVNAQRSLEFSRTRLSAILKNTSEITLIVDKDGIVKYVSPAAEHILGYSVIDIVGSNIADYIVQKQRENFMDMLNDLKYSGFTGFSSFEFQAANEKSRCLRVKATNKLENEYIKGIIISAQDITELEEAYDQLESEHNNALKYHARLLSSQLNPHFIFNALNSIQYYILENNQEPALHYLSSFAGLMRQTLNNSKSDFLSLKDEIEFLNNYISLEESRFRKKFDYSIDYSKDVVPEDLFVPPMFIQPHVENAIIHGISNLKSQGKLEIKFFIEGKLLMCQIRDNGVGRKKAKELKNLRSGSEYKSMAMSLTTTRLNILNQLEDEKFDVRIKDLVDSHGDPAGTEVFIEMPLIMDV